ncbi:hypothetical protein [Sphingomonas sp. RB1R13]|uniref:hypothetical protein n=1 Tax=Sphingomonas sp. RB1R13 TaxID=3096159 RepID=UPI002FC89AED
MQEVLRMVTLNPHWKGERILSLKKPIVRGIAELHRILNGKDFGSFTLESSFSYDDSWEELLSIDGWPSLDAAQADLVETLIRRTEQLFRENPEWRIIENSVLPVNVLPATGSIVPGRFPVEAGARKLGNPVMYESCYLRSYIIERRETPLAAQILAFDGIAAPLISYLAKIGQVAAAVEI